MFFPATVYQIDILEVQILMRIQDIYIYICLLELINRLDSQKDRPCRILG